MIETNRCRIVKLQENDYDNVRELYFDKEVRQFLGGAVSGERFDNSFSKMIASCENSFYWVITLKANNEFIGLVSIDKHHDDLNFEVSYQFKPNYWGYGYAEEVIKRIISYAFDVLKLEKLVAETQSANKASCNLLQKLGMHLEQVVQRFGAEQYIFSIFKNAL